MDENAWRNARCSRGVGTVTVSRHEPSFGLFEDPQNKVQLAVHSAATM